MKCEARPWAAHAACAGVGQEMFFPKTHTPAGALKLCASCPVRLECLIWAIENDEHGVWGGLSHKVRSRTMLPELYAQLEERNARRAS